MEWALLQELKRTLVNYVGLNEDILNYILEIKGSYKIGKYMPGTNIPIVDEKIILKKSQIIYYYYHGIFLNH